jgi:hypothetical protein
MKKIKQKFVLPILFIFTGSKGLANFSRFTGFFSSGLFL